jgi:hypothetical protein
MLERRANAAIRDILAGAALLALGLLTRSSSLDGGADGIDYLFDAIGLFWIGWGVFRLVRRRHNEGSSAR